MAKGAFREDLFYRLNVVPIYVPPLRDRREDIPVLVRHFADLFSRENNFRRKTFTQAAMDRLRQHYWRGNIRELRNFVERVIIMTNGDQIDVRDLPDFGSLRPADSSAAAPAAAAAIPDGTVEGSAPGAPDLAWMRAATLQEFKATSERAFLVAKLRENGWNISKTAEVIDTPRSNLYKKLEQYQISQERDG
jgi:two-component system nitrogen regulation response regulator NtrX